MNFGDITEEYLKYVCLKGKPQSIRSIKNRIKNYVKPYFYDYNIEDITSGIYLEWQSKINEKNFSYKYKKSLHYTMVSIFNYAFKFYNYGNNIPSKIGNFSNSYDLIKESNYWNINEFNKFISKVDNIIYKSLFEFMFYTGARLGECLALTFNDIEDNIIKINKTISKEYINGKRQITTPKTKKSIREIHIDIKTQTTINNLVDYYNTKYNYFTNNFYIFGGIKPLAPTTVERHKNNACELAKVKQIKLHEFRHSHATILYYYEIPVKDISERLGHKDINITLDTYIHLIKNDEKRVLDTLNFIH